MIEWLQVVLLFLGSLFFGLGTLGLFRFPDTLTRIHALTKVDNLGLGLVVLALLMEASTWVVASKILLVWMAALVASATSAHLVAGVLRIRRESENE